MVLNRVSIFFFILTEYTTKVDNCAPLIAIFETLQVRLSCCVSFCKKKVVSFTKLGCINFDFQ